MSDYKLDYTGPEIDEAISKAFTALQIANNAGAHNCIYRGVSLGDHVTAEQWAAIGAGTFAGLFPGDYWTINGIDWLIAHCNYWLGTGSTECTTPHAVIVPRTGLFKPASGSIQRPLNSTNTTSGAYVGSDFYTENNSNTTKADCTAIIEAAFGASHILSHREYLKNTVTNGYESSGAWYDSTVELMSEYMVYGHDAYGNASRGANKAYYDANSKTQLALFAHDPSLINTRDGWWLRDVASDENFAIVDYGGRINNTGAADTWVDIRPVFAICAEQESS